MSRKCYGQFCPMATALDVVGDRWTLLVLRELLGGPARFSELEDGLPGIAKNLLSSRLRSLERDGILRQVRTRGSRVYALTELGAAIRPALEELGFWGTRVRRTGPAVHPRSIRAVAMALQSILARAHDALPEDGRVIELEVDGEFLEIQLGPRPTAAARPSTDPDARLRTSASAMSQFLSGGGLDPERLIHLSGEPAARTSLIRALDAVGLRECGLVRPDEVMTGR